MDRITFHVNGNKYTVGSEVDSDVTLNDYLRNELNLRGTKFMCKEGGCGSCIVAVTAPHRGTFSVNSCLVSVTSCQDWEIETIEGIGNRRKGYHPVQRALAEYNGTQCGYCSPGWVMSMYSLLESRKYDLTELEVENSFGSNTCRCTGYRPILEAFKSFAKDAPKPNITDIEDLKLCSKQKEHCKKDCQNEWCFIEKSDIDGAKKIFLKDDRIWYRVKEISSIFDILDKEGTISYMLVNGNTGRGAVPILQFPRVLIDISPIEQLKGYIIDQNLIIGAGTTLTEFMEICKKISNDHQDFFYLEKFYEHLDLVAHIPVRNIGSIAGNLMTKHRHPTFSSDIFLLLESVGAVLTIENRTQTVQLTPADFLTLDMTGRVITRINLPPLSDSHKFVSFKIMTRYQNAHAQVNGAFLYKLNFEHKDPVVINARIVYGGISARFVHAVLAEIFLQNKKLFTNEVLQQTLHILNEEIKAEDIPGDLGPEYRKKCALGLFYKGLLQLQPKNNLKPIYRSGRRNFRRTRPVSQGSQVFDTNPSLWPVNEPMPKLEALIQCAGEAKYVNDLPTQPEEVFGAFVTSDICTGEIESIDASPALKLPGVLAFFSAKDIPGINSFMSQRIQIQPIPEELFADKRVYFYDQPIGMIVAETERLAYQASLLVHVKYKIDDKEPIITIKDAQERDPTRVKMTNAYPPRNAPGADVTRIIKGVDKSSWQYPFTMEVQSTVSRPSDEGIDVFSSTQWPDHVHTAISDVLNIPQNRIHVQIPRCGGAYGAKLSRPSQIAAACALATYLLNRPCRFVLSIQSNIRSIGKRPSCQREFEAGVNERGEIQYVINNIYDDTGYRVTEAMTGILGPTVKNCYDNSRWDTKVYVVTTDIPKNTYIRAPGSFEGICMTEIMMERISIELDKDPVEVRLNNFDPQAIEAREIIDTLLKDSNYYKRRKDVENFNKLNRWKKRGLRVAFMNYPIIRLHEFNVLMSVYHGDGSITIKHGGVEMGQGINTKVVQAVAYTLKLPIDKIKVFPTDTAANPNTIADNASRTTQAATFGVIKCCQILLDRLSIIRESLNNPTWEVLVREANIRGINLQVSYRVTNNDQILYKASGAAVLECELDILTGEHEIRRVDLIEDVGLSLNPEIDVGQVEGAYVMALGIWTSEEIRYDKKTGENLTDRTWTYYVPLAKDIPLDFRIQFRRNSYNPVGTLGAKGVNELPMCLGVNVAFALHEAIRSSRSDSGYPKKSFMEFNAPFTLEHNVLTADVKLEEFLFN